MPACAEGSSAAPPLEEGILSRGCGPVPFGTAAGGTGHGKFHTSVGFDVTALKFLNLQ